MVRKLFWKEKNDTILIWCYFKISKNASCIIYDNCNFICIGQTDRNFNVRFSEHLRSWCSNNTDSNVAKHTTFFPRIISKFFMYKQWFKIRPTCNGIEKSYFEEFSALMIEILLWLILSLFNQFNIYFFPGLQIIPILYKFMHFFVLLMIVEIYIKFLHRSAVFFLIIFLIIWDQSSDLSLIIYLNFVYYFFFMSIVNF